MLNGGKLWEKVLKKASSTEKRTKSRGNLDWLRANSERIWANPTSDSQNRVDALVKVDVKRFAIHLSPTPSF